MTTRRQGSEPVSSTDNRNAIQDDSTAARHDARAASLKSRRYLPGAPESGERFTPDPPEGSSRASTAKPHCELQGAPAQLQCVFLGLLRPVGQHSQKRKGVQVALFFGGSNVAKWWSSREETPLVIPRAHVRSTVRGAADFTSPEVPAARVSGANLQLTAGRVCYPRSPTTYGDANQGAECQEST